MKLFSLALGIVFNALIAVSAFAQTAPIVATINQNDLIGIVPGGAPTAQRYFVYPGQIASAPTFQNLGTITTGNTFAVTTGVSNVFAQAAGTLAAVTLTAPANPSDGQKICFTSNQITTALTLSANTGQTVTAGGTALGAAHVPICWTYVKSALTWY